MLLALAATAAPRAAPAQEGTTVYRCTDARGKVSLRDTPCAKEQRQQIRQMMRPMDPAAAPKSPRETAPEPRAAEPATRVVVVNAPRPMYECVDPDGERYTSESAEGNPRWVPLWTLGYPGLAETTVVRPGSGGVRVRDGRVDARFRSGDVQRAVVPTIAAYGAGTWIRDACYALPQSETCARLADRRDEIRRQFFNAQPSERARLTVEERGIAARLGDDCGAR